MSIAKEAIEQVISTLDVSNDSHWTEEGLPNPELVHQLLGSPADPEVSQMAAWIAWAAPDIIRVKPIEPIVEETPAEDKTETETTSILEEVLEDTRSIFEKSLAVVEAAEKAVADAKNFLANAIAAHDVLILEEDNKPSTDPIQDYLRSQREKLAEQAIRVQEFNARGGNVNNKSALDMALANRKRNG